ncbi:MAG: XrtA/PEP-CTERM system TPR-repeat protein PrsT [Pseudomonadota bacterium]
MTVRATLRSVLVAVAVLLGACQPSPEERLARAEQFVAAGDFAAAVIEARGALQEQPANLQARIVFANASRLSGDYRTAYAEYQRARELGLEDPLVLAQFAEVAVIAGRPQVVVDQLSQVLEAEPKRADALSTLAHAYALTGDPERAEALYRQALMLSNQTAQAYVGLASIAQQRGDTQGVAEWVAAAEQSVPGNSLVLLFRSNAADSDDEKHALLQQAYANLDGASTPALRAQILLARVENHLRRQEYDPAQEALAEYRQSNPGSPQSVFFGALIALQKGDLEKAKAGFLRLSEGLEDGSAVDLFLGSINLRQANLRQAEAYLNNALRLDGNSVQARKLLAETLLQLGRSKAALDILAELNVDQTQDPQILALLGRASIATGDAAGSVDFFKRSSAYAPDNPSLKLATAYSYLAAGDADAALALLEQMPNGDDDNFRPQTLRMLAHLTAQDEPAAIAEAQRLAQSNPANPAALSLAGQLMASIGRTDAAVEFFNTALAKDAAYLPARQGLGNTLVQQQKYEQAFAVFEKVLDQEPGYFPAVSAFGKVAVRLGREQAALQRVRAAIDASPNDPAPRIVLAQYHLQNGAADQARDVVNEALTIAPDDTGLLRLRALTGVRLGLIEASLRDITKAAELAPENRDIQFDKARLLLSSGDLKGANRTLREYLTLRPDDTAMRLFAADVDLRSGNVAAALGTVERILEAQPENRAATIIRGDIEAQRGELRKALGYYDQAASISNDRLLTLRRFGALTRLEDPRAQQVLDAWLTENPGDVEIEVVLAQALQGAGSDDGAAERYEAIVQNDSAGVAQRAIALNNLAWLYYSRGDARALDLAEQAAALAPDSAPITDTLGWILLENGERQRALTLLQKAHELAPDDPSIGYHLAECLSRNKQRSEALALVTDVLQGDRDFPERSEAQALLASLR